jgi:hypothetical protein
MPPKKSKKQTEVVVEKPVVAVAPVVVEPVVVATVIEPVVEKKRAKKAPKIVATVTPEGITGNFQGDMRRPLIVHLKVNSSTVNFSSFPIQYDPNPPVQPEPYEPGFDNYFSNQNETLSLQAKADEADKKNEQPKVVVKNDGEAEPLPCFTTNDLMVQ